MEINDPMITTKIDIKPIMIDGKAMELKKDKSIIHRPSNWKYCWKSGFLNLAEVFKAYPVELFRIFFYKYWLYTKKKSEK